MRDTDISLHGVYPYLVTPLDGDGRVKRAVLTRLVDHLIDAGVHGLTPLGSTGEFAYLIPCPVKADSRVVFGGGSS